MKKNLLFLFALLIMSIGGVKAQALAGNYSIPSATYATIGSIINDLNAFGISGPVTIDVAAGHTETAPLGGYTLTATGTAANPIIFQKSGIGANPLITAFAGGLGLPNTASQDGIWRFIGSDYITIDGIDLVDLNATSPDYMEFGYGFFKSSVTDGCQNNTIKNCVITLNRNNFGVGSGTAVDGCRGIEFVNATTNAHTTALVITAASGSHSFNKIYRNTIQNVNIGIAMIGFAATTPFTLADQSNDIGGSASATGNTIINFGGAATATTAAAGIRTLNQYTFNASYNTINNNNGSGFNHQNTLRGILVGAATSANATINNNTITVKSATLTAALIGIENASGATAAGNLISISNNLITNCTYSTATSGAFTGILNSASAASVNISNNSFVNNSTNATSGTNFMIQNTGAATSAININANSVNGFTFAAASAGSYSVISNSGGTATASLSISNNSFQAISNAVAATGGHGYITNSAATGTQNISNNQFINLSINTTGGVTFMMNSVSLPATGLQTVSNNSIVTGFNKLSAGGTVYLFYSNASSSAGSQVLQTNNNFSNITLTGATTVNGWHNTDGGTPSKTITANVFSNWTCGTSAVIGINLNFGIQASISSNTITNITGAGAITGIARGASGTGAAETFSNNLINNLTSNSPGGTVMGISGGSSGITNFSIISNTISTLSSAGASSVNALNMSGGATINILKNKIYDLQSNNAGGMVNGVLLSGGTTANTYNNLIGDLKAPLASAVSPVNGINITGGTNQNLYYNSVHLNATSTGLNFGSSAILASTTPNVNLRNNIFVNNSTANGTGFTVAYRRSSATLTTYSSTSNNNLLYAGTPSAINLIYYDGTTPQQTLGAFKTLVAPRDAVSVTENPPFVTTVGSNPNFLNISTSIATQIESGAAPITGITDDYIGTLRNAGSPDIGAWEGNYITSADLLPPSFLVSGFTSPACNATSRTFTMNITDVSGVANGALLPRVYYKVNSNPYTSTQATLTSGNQQNGVYTFSMSYTAVAGDIISYYVVAQDIATTPNLGASPSVGFSGIDVNNVTTPPTTPNSYAVAMTLAGSYNVGTTGTFTSLTQAANAYNTSCLAGPVTFVLIDPNYSVNETFPIVFNNNPYANATNSLLVVPAPALGVTIGGTTTANTTIKFLNSQFITFDGLNSGGSSLSVYNPNTGTSAVFWLASTSATGPGNNTTGLKNMYIEAGGNSTIKYGILAGVDGASPVATGGIDNDNTTISGNTITASYYGIYALSTATTAVANNNWTISNNLIGSVVSSTANIFSKGIYLSYIDGLALTNNTVMNVTGTTAYVWGIELNAGVRNATLSKNTITGIRYTGTGGYGGLGIDVNPNHVAANITIDNNMISDCTGDGWSSFTAGGFAGIRVAVSGTCVGVNIRNNSIALNQGTSIAAATTNELSAAIYFGSGANNVDLRNNILYSTVEYTNQAGSRTYAIYSAANPTVFTNINYNDYFVGGTQGVLGFVSAAQQANLAAIIASFGQNANSVNSLPTFAGINDLHLPPATNAIIDNLGTPIAGITLDIDNQTRSLTTPDIGADEFTAPTCTTASSGNIATTSYSICNNGSITLVANNVSTGNGTSYQWMVSTNPAGPYSNAVGGTGVTTPTYITAALPTNTLYYILQTVCAPLSLTATSAPSATVFINPIPTASISAAANPICAGNTLSLSVGTDIGTNFMWTGPASYTSNVQNPLYVVPANGTGNYSVLVSTGNCTAAVQQTLVTVNSTNLAITATGVYFCTSGTTTLTAVGNATSVVWSTSATTNSIIESVSTSTVYSVTGSNATGCPATATIGVTVINPTITGIGDAVCSPTAVGTLSATSFGPIKWYNSPTSTVVLGSGNTFTASSASTTTFYAQAISTTIGSLQTTFAGGNGCGGGNMFDVTPTSGNIVMDSLDVNFSATGTQSVFIYYRVGTFAGNEQIAANWIPWDTVVVTSAGPGNPTRVVMNSLAIPNSQLTGMYVRYNANYTNGTLTYTNTDISVQMGTGLCSAFSGTNAGRMFNGNFYYTKPGCTSPMIPVTLTVSTPPNLSVATTPSNVICAGSSVTLTASGATTYTWNTSATTAAISDTPASTTSYTVTGASPGCSGVYSLATTVTVNPVPSVSINVSPSNMVCANTTLTLTASGATTYTWNTSATSTVINDVPSTTTTYSVNAETPGCPGTYSAATTVTVNPTPSVSIAASPSGSICAGNSVLLTASGASSYTWNTSATSAAINPLLFVSTNFSVTATSTACAGNYTANFFVTVNPTPTVNITASSMSICTGNSVNLTATGATSYSWSTSATTSTISASPTVSTIYSVTGTNGNCTGTKTINITVNAKPTVSLSAASNTACLMGGPVTLTGSPAGGVYSGPNVSGNTLNPTATGTFTPMYSFTNTSTGCSNTATMNIVVSVCTDIVSQSAKTAYLKVYPNPNFGTFTIETANDLVKTIELTDVTGRIVHSQQTNSETIQMNINELANGVYHVRISSQNGNDIIKVVKQ